MANREKPIDILETNTIQCRERLWVRNDMWILDGVTVQCGDDTGVKFGDSSSQKLGFYGVTPVDQPATVSDAATQDITGSDTVDKTKTEADLTSCKNAINAIIDRLQELGLIA